MKCHRVLGIEESASESSIEQAYNTKICSLYSIRGSLSDEFINKKVGELLTAKDECLRWTSITNSERLSLRIREKGDFLTSPNVMYTSPIGFCSACVGGCCGAFEDDSCVKCVCGENSSDGCVSCANKVDIGLYVAAGLAALWGLITLIGKIAPAVHEGNKAHRETRRNEAITKNQNLQAELNQALLQLNHANDFYSFNNTQYVRIVAFCDFLTSINCGDCSNVVARQQAAVNTAAEEVTDAQRTVDRIQHQIQKNSRYM